MNVKKEVCSSPENPTMEDVVEAGQSTGKQKRKMIKCTECKELKPHHGQNMCWPCHRRLLHRSAELEKSKHKTCVECKGTKIISEKGMCGSCYERIFRSSKKVERQRARRLAKKQLIKHIPLQIPKVELQSESEDDFNMTKDVSSDEEDGCFDSKAGIKCEPSTSKDY